MSSTVLEIVASALWPVAGSRPPSTIISSTDQDQLKIRHIIQEVARELRDELRTPAMKWRTSFDLEANRTKYPLPQNFYELITMTGYDVDAQWHWDGPLSDGTFVYVQTRGWENYRLQFRIFGPDQNPNSPGGQFELAYTPSAGGLTVQYDYFASDLFKGENWAPSTAFSLNDEVNNDGKRYKCTTGGTTGTGDGPTHSDGSAVADGTAEWTHLPAAKETIGADTDLCVFDDSVMILGTRIKYLEGTSMDVSRWVREYENAKKRSSFRYNGAVTGNFSSPRTTTRWRPFPDGNWSFS